MKLVTDSQHLEYSAVLFARVCAARLDPKLSAEDFVAMLGRLLDVAIAEATEESADENVERDKLTPEQLRIMRELNGESTSSTGAAAARPNAAQPTNPDDVARASPAAPTLSRLHDTADDDSGVIDVTAYPASEPESPGAALPIVAESRPAATDATGTPRARGNRRVVTDADRAAIKADYLAALGDRKRVPWGTYDLLAEKHGFSAHTIKNIVVAMHLDARAVADTRSNAPKVVHAEREQNQRPAHEVDQTAETEREVVHLDDAGRVHTNSNACWCRKGANKAGNYWCPNKPGPGQPVGLRSKVPPTARNERFSGGMARAPHIRDVE